MVTVCVVVGEMVLLATGLKVTLLPKSVVTDQLM